MSKELKQIHDLMLAMKPEGFASEVHDEATCPYCLGLHDDPEGGSMSDKDLTAEELASAVETVKAARSKGKKAEAAAGVSANVADAISKIDELVDELMDHLGIPDKDADATPGDNASLVAAQARVKELETQLASKDAADLQAKLDAAVIEAEAAKNEKAALEQFLADAKAADELKASQEAKREERIAALKEHAGFPEKYLEENADRFVAMSDEEFDARLEEYKALSGKGEGASQIPSQTALHAARQTTSTKPASALSEISALRQSGVDPRLVRS